MLDQWIRKEVIFSKLAKKGRGLTLVRKYVSQCQNHHARLSTNRSLFFVMTKHSTPLFWYKSMIGLRNFVKKSQ